MAHGMCKATGCNIYYLHRDIHYCEYHHRQMKTEDDKVESLKEIKDALLLLKMGKEESEMKNEILKLIISMSEFTNNSEHGCGINDEVCDWMTVLEDIANKINEVSQ